MAELEAGRELDALVAAKVMGRAKFQPGKGPVAEHPLEELSLGLYTERIPVPRYSADIDAAWKVVERMRALGWHIVIDSRPGNWLVQFFSTDGRKHSAASADLVPLAICRAAIAALSTASAN